MDKQLIIIICVCVIVAALVITVATLLILKKIKQKKKAKLNPDSSDQVDLISELSKISNLVSNNKYLSKSNYSNASKTFESGLIMVNSFGLFVINEFNYEGKMIEGSFGNREWYITRPRAKYYIYNPLWKLNKNIKDLIPILPNNLPIVGILVFNQINNFEIHNSPSHLTYTTLDNFYETFYQIKKNLKPILSTENVDKIIDLLKYRSS
ncbi:NERD domain-containing protein [Mycoplasma enhydrae]|uniref:NERD domain-containing protein n=1 Tax=Mycoplasma enhydrae TaxID=2499220 RepID=UPI00197B41C0|nr:NERD domain-containing protein [Mycoplasma enhydrae]MBN4089265.1 NERD domain-containing protein [Mycoplasma enhydrae]MCV3733575.1 NERD domain-containing protein [Mycoplasma enhydrae]MCV3753449.1 NERD domain-containing protein [Mycoplasma enhydrae]